MKFLSPFVRKYSRLHAKATFAVNPATRVPASGHRAGEERWVTQEAHDGGSKGRHRPAVTLRRLVEALTSYRPDRVYLFGSWTTGEADELSDVDLVVIKSTPAPFFERLREINKLLPSDFGAIDILVYTPEEFADMKANGNVFGEMVEAEGVILYDTTRA